MEQLITAVGVVALGALGWISLEFIGRPIRSFLDLRREIRRQVIFLENLGPLHPLDEENSNALAKAALTLRDLGAQAIAFDQTEWLAARVVRWSGIQPMQGGRGLIGLANTLENETEAENYRTVVEHALRFDRMGEYDWKHAPE